MKRLSSHEADEIRKGGLDLSDKHLQLRVFQRIDLTKVKTIFEEGEMYQEGKTKFRAVCRFGDITGFVIFERRHGTNVLKTVGITHGKRRWG